MSRHTRLRRTLASPVRYRNTLRGTGPFAQKKRQTECINGHEFTADNTIYSQRGTRGCRECRRASWRRWKARQRDGREAAP